MYLLLLVIIIIISLLILILILSKKEYPEEYANYHHMHQYMRSHEQIYMQNTVFHTEEPSSEDTEIHEEKKIENEEIATDMSDEKKETSETKAKVVDVVEDESRELEEMAKESLDTANLLFLTVEKKGKMYDEISKNITLAKTYYNMGKYESSMEYSKKAMDIAERLSEGACMDCGYLIKEGWKKCPRCGKEVSE